MVRCRQALCRAMPIGSSFIGLRTCIQPIGKYYKIMLRFLSGNPITEHLCIVNRPRRRGAGSTAAVAAWCHAAQPRCVHHEPAFRYEYFPKGSFLHGSDSMKGAKIESLLYYTVRCRQIRWFLSLLTNLLLDTLSEQRPRLADLLDLLNALDMFLNR